MVEVSASLLSMEKENAINTFYNLETAKIDYFHIDVMDGKFVKRNTMEDMQEYALTISHISNIGLDVHLMVENVEEVMDDYIMLEPHIITFHIEAITDKQRIMDIIHELKENNIKVGIALNPDTLLETVKEYLPYIHMVLVMTAMPGAGGQGLIPETLDKIRELKQYVTANHIDIDIEVDCGINESTAKDVVEAGANIIAVGSHLTNSENYAETVRRLKN